jgi:hypothetical protein
MIPPNIRRALEEGSIRDPQFHEKRDQKWRTDKATFWKGIGTVLSLFSYLISSGTIIGGTISGVIYGGKAVPMWYKMPLGAVGGGALGAAFGGAVTFTLLRAISLFKSDKKVSGILNGMGVAIGLYLAIMAGQYYNHLFVKFGSPEIPIVDRIPLPFCGSNAEKSPTPQARRPAFGIGANSVS